MNEKVVDTSNSKNRTNLFGGVKAYEDKEGDTVMRRTLEELLDKRRNS